MTDLLKPANAAATVVPVPAMTEFQLTLPFTMVQHAINANVSLKAMTVAAFMLLAEANRGAHVTLDDLFEMVGVGYPDEFVVQGLTELMSRNLAFWYEEDGDTYYILTQDFSRVK